MPEVYRELRDLAAARLAREPAGHTLDATALVHEAYLKLAARSDLGDRSAFFRAAAMAMQRILVDHARKRRAGKRGAGARRIDLREIDCITLDNPDLVLDLDTALERLAAEDPGAADVARLRLFAGLGVEEAAEVLGLARATAYREWTYARTWLRVALADEE